MRTESYGLRMRISPHVCFYSLPLLTTLSYQVSTLPENFGSPCDNLIAIFYHHVVLSCLRPVEAVAILNTPSKITVNVWIDRPCNIASLVCEFTKKAAQYTRLSAEYLQMWTVKIDWIYLYLTFTQKFERRCWSNSLVWSGHKIGKNVTTCWHNLYNFRVVKKLLCKQRYKVVENDFFGFTKKECLSYAWCLDFLCCRYVRPFWSSVANSMC